MQLYISWYIRSFFGFTFLNIVYVFKYSCNNIFHWRSLYIFYQCNRLSHHETTFSSQRIKLVETILMHVMNNCFILCWKLDYRFTIPCVLSLVARNRLFKKNCWLDAGWMRCVYKRKVCIYIIQMHHTKHQVLILFSGSIPFYSTYLIVWYDSSTWK